MQQAFEKIAQIAQYFELIVQSIDKHEEYTPEMLIFL